MGNFRSNDRGGRSDGFRGRSGGFNRSRGGFGDRGSFGNRGGFNRNRRPAEMYDAVCDKCKKECQVPFRPSAGKPVLCSDCFRQDGGSRQDKGFSSRGNRSSGSPGISADQFKQINTKLDKILNVLENIEIVDEDEEELENEAEEEDMEDEAEESEDEEEEKDSEEVEEEAETEESSKE